MQNTNQIKTPPCLIQTEHGGTILYHDKYLYSKYNPSKSILNIIESLTILPGTLFLCCSPILPYGLKELSKKLPKDCFLLGIELDEQLLTFEQKYYKEYEEKNGKINNFSLLTKQESLNLPQILQENDYILASNINFSPAGKFKRVIKIDFSAGTNFYITVYNELYSYCVNSIMTFWKNRITLTKFGRKYSLDLFRNLKILEKTTPISNFFEKIEKPIILFGAGESLENGIEELKYLKNDFYILCADTALNPLLKKGLHPNGVFIEEAQSVILKSFIGCLNTNIHIFAGLSSIPQLNHLTNFQNISYFLTLYSTSIFLRNLSTKSFIESINKPFGSVGITMVYYALKFRKNENIPIYIYGLDFSYSIGKTHANGTMAHSNLLLNSNRINPIGNYESSFSNISKQVNDKNNNYIITTPVLQNYANIFSNLFYNEKNLYDSSEKGLNLSITQKKPQIFESQNIISKQLFSSFCEKQITELNDFLNEEKNNLIYLRDILTGKEILSKEEQSEKIKNILKQREYLYIHFADGFKIDFSQSFLNRIRTEIDFFLKILK